MIKIIKYGWLPILITLIICTMIIIIIGMPGILGSARQSQLVACQFNIAKIGIALEMYRDKENSYPPSLSVLVPNYLEKIPHCPGNATLWTLWKPFFGIRSDAGDTYSKGYITNNNFTKYTLYCTGRHNYSLAPGALFIHTSDDFHPKFFWIKRIMRDYHTIDFVSVQLPNVVIVDLKTCISSDEAKKLADAVSKSYFDIFKENREVWIWCKNEILAEKR